MNIDGKNFSTSNQVAANWKEDWIRIATEIELNYNFDAFVILHGTDTMAYTASALSFLLEDLGKTVVCIIIWSVAAPLLHVSSRYYLELKYLCLNYGTMPWTIY